MWIANLHQNPEQINKPPNPSRPPDPPSKFNFPHYTKDWAFSFHKSVPRGTFFAANAHPTYISSIFPKCEQFLKVSTSKSQKKAVASRRPYSFSKRSKP